MKRRKVSAAGRARRAGILAARNHVRAQYMAVDALHDVIHSDVNRAVAHILGALVNQLTDLA